MSRPGWFAFLKKYYTIDLIMELRQTTMPEQFEPTIGNMLLLSEIINPTLTFIMNNWINGI